MTFSIVVITLNEEKYVGKLLKRLKNQTYKDFEVIVVDGQSEDKTIEVVNSFKDDLNLKIIVAQKRGPSIQRNIGVKEVKNEHIVFFDADILVSSTFLEEIKNKLSKRPNSMCLSSRHVSLPRNLFHDISLFLGYVYLRSVSKTKPCAMGSFIYVRKEAFEDVGGFDESFIFGEDSDLVRRLNKKRYKFHIIHSPVIEYSMRRVKVEGLINVYKRTINSIIILRNTDYISRLKAIKYKFSHYND